MEGPREWLAGFEYIKMIKRIHILVFYALSDQGLECTVLRKTCRCKPERGARKSQSMLAIDAQHLCLKLDLLEGCLADHLPLP